MGSSKFKNINVQSKYNNETKNESNNTKIKSEYENLIDKQKSQIEELRSNNTD
jgi:hypothetical protein